MRNSCPFVFDIVVFGKSRTKVSFVQFVILIAHPFRSQTSAVLYEFVGDKFSNSANIVWRKRVVRNSSIYRFRRYFSSAGLSLFEKMLHQKRLIDCRGNFRGKD